MKAELLTKVNRFSSIKEKKHYTQTERKVTISLREPLTWHPAGVGLVSGGGDSGIPESSRSQLCQDERRAKRTISTRNKKKTKTSDPEKRVLLIKKHWGASSNQEESISRKLQSKQVQREEKHLI